MFFDCFPFASGAGAMELQLADAVEVIFKQGSPSILHCAYYAKSMLTNSTGNTV